MAKIFRFLAVAMMMGGFGWAMYYHFNSPPMPIVAWYASAVMCAFGISIYLIIELLAEL